MKKLNYKKESKNSNYYDMQIKSIVVNEQDLIPSNWHWIKNRYIMARGHY